MRNQFKVPLNKWKKWSILAKKVFNSQFETLKNNQKVLTHPQMKEVSKRMWSTVAWNSAWLAADAVDTGLKEIEKGET